MKLDIERVIICPQGGHKRGKVNTPYASHVDACPASHLPFWPSFERHRPRQQMIPAHPLLLVVKYADQTGDKSTHTLCVILLFVHQYNMLYGVFDMCLTHRP